MTERSRTDRTLPHVLVVDDQEAVRDAVRLLLKHSGYRTSLEIMERLSYISL